MRYLSVILCAALVLFSLHQTQAKIIHVPADSSTIQGGINGAINGDTVLVQPETYIENINFLGKAILVASQFILDSLESTIDSTVIDGNRMGSVVTFNSGEDSNSVIQGFTLTGGYATYGGGIHCLASSPTIADNFIVGNECGPGKGGPGIYCRSGSHARIYRNLIANCSGPAAIFLYIGCDAQVVNNTVCYNSWGGFSVQSNSNAYVKNNIFSNNIDYGIHVSESSCDLLYNDVYGSERNYVGLPDQTGVNGNISADPLFCDAENGNYYLYDVSPCVGAGQGGTNMGALAVGCDNVPPNPFRLLLPPNKAFTPRVVRFDWETATDPDPSSELTYDLYVSTSFPPDSTTPAHSDLAISEHIKTLDYGTYYWMVKAKDGHGGERWSQQIGYFMVTGIHASLGDFNLDGFVDAGDVVSLINYLYTSGPAPDPLEAADVNCDRTVDVTDVVYLINYLFLGGSPPCEL